MNARLAKTERRTESLLDEKMAAVDKRIQQLESRPTSN